MNKVPVILEALCYLLSKLKRADKIHLVKLMYLADKYHLMNYGRTISGDSFVAFENGPAGSKTTDILEFDGYVLREYIDLAKQLIKKGEGYQYLPSEECPLDSFDMLSESDIDALDFVINNFGKMDQWDVVDYTHQLKEWKQFKPLFDSGETRRELIKTEELLWPTDDKYFHIPEEHLKESYEILTGAGGSGGNSP
jgi:uncharacterized phage-associated protein